MVPKWLLLVKMLRNWPDLEEESGGSASGENGFDR